MESRVLRKLFPLICLGVFVAGCGNVANTHGGQYPLNPFSSGSLSGAIGYDGSYTQGSYNCPPSPNVMPNDQNPSDDGSYSVCPNTSSAADILIHGYISASSTICVFPAQYVDSSHIYAKPDPTTGLPWYQCADFSQATSGIYANFPNASYNAVFIVVGGDAVAMQRCLYSANPLTCPNYSYGKFR